MDSEVYLLWNDFYIIVLLKKNVVQVWDVSIKQFFSDGSVYWGENFRFYIFCWKEEVRGNMDMQIDNIYYVFW